jgi:hypothetical protein
MKPSYAVRITESGVSGEAKLVARTMLATSVAFVEALNAFLSNFYGGLTKENNKTSGKEAWSLVRSIVRRIYAVHRCRASFVDVKNEVKQQIATKYLWASP